MARTTNTDSVTFEDRGVSGNQPDFTPAGGGEPTGGGGGGGTPTGPAGGDLAGTYPDPTLAVIGSAAGPIGNATNVAQVTIDAKGRVMGLTAVPITYPANDLPTGGAKYNRLAKNSATNYDVGWYGQPVFNVQDYGAVPNSSGAAGSNVTAINGAITDMVAAGGGILYFPPLGIWYVNSLINFGANAFSICVDGGFMGDCTIMQTANNTGVFYCQQSARDVCFGVRKIRLAHNGTPSLSTASAVVVVNTVNGANDNAANLIVREVDVRCDSGSGKAFTYGFQLQNIKNSNWDAYYYTGDVAGGGTGVLFEVNGGGGAGLKCIGATMVNCYMTLAGAGVRITGAMEGFFISNSQLVGLTYGINSDYAVHLAVNNCHINAEFCVNSTGTGGNVDQAIVTNSLLYQQGTNKVGVLGGFDRSVFNSNVFLSPSGDAGTLGIDITGGTGNGGVGNTFYNQQVSYIRVACNDSQFSINTATNGAGTAATPYDDNGAGNTFLSNINT